MKHANLLMIGSLWKKIFSKFFVVNLDEWKKKVIKKIFFLNAFLCTEKKSALKNKKVLLNCVQIFSSTFNQGHGKLSIECPALLSL